jgi:hypothetical protein
MGLLEVTALCLGSCGFSLGQGPLERLVLRGGGGSRVCSLLSLFLYPTHVHYASLTLSANYWGLEWWAPQTKGLIIA